MGTNTSEILVINGNSARLFHLPTHAEYKAHKVYIYLQEVTQPFPQFRV